MGHFLCGAERWHSQEFCSRGVSHLTYVRLLLTFFSNSWNWHNALEKILSKFVSREAWSFRPRGVTKLDGARDKKQVWRPYIRTRKQRRHTVLKKVFVTLFGLFGAPCSHSAHPQWFGARGVVLPLPPRYAPLSASFWLRYWCRKDKAFCERLVTLYDQQSEKYKQHVDLAPLEKFVRTPMVTCWDFS